MATWHVQQGGQPKGPYSDEQLKALCEAGAVTAATMVWRDDFPTWKPLAETDFVFKSAMSPPPIATSATRQAAISPAATGTDTIVDDLSPWGYFARALTERYAEFNGRARRKEYWYYTLFYVIFLFVFLFVGAFIDGAAGNIGPERGERAVPIVMVVLVCLAYLATLIPTLAVLVRRLHDVGLSGWLALLLIVPYLGALILLVLTLLPSDSKSNKHGPRPVSAS